MQRAISFSYSYSAKDNSEIQEIRRKYLPQTDSKMEELKRLDRQGQKAGIAEALTAGVSWCLLFGLGLCLVMRVIGNGVIALALGVLAAIIGIVSMLLAYPIYSKVYNKTKDKLAPRILYLTTELIDE